MCVYGGVGVDVVLTSSIVFTVYCSSVRTYALVVVSVPSVRFVRGPRLVSGAIPGLYVELILSNGSCRIGHPVWPGLLVTCVYVRRCYSAVPAPAPASAPGMARASLHRTPRSREEPCNGMFFAAHVATRACAFCGEKARERDSPPSRWFDRGPSSLRPGGGCAALRLPLATPRRHSRTTFGY